VIPLWRNAIIGRSEVACQRGQDIVYVRNIESHTYKNTVVSDESGSERGNAVNHHYRDFGISLYRLMPISEFASPISSNALIAEQDHLNWCQKPGSVVILSKN
jgi:hypothetical protein